MIVQKHKHLDGTIAYMKFQNKGYNVSLETYNPQTKSIQVLNYERFMKHHDANNWMDKQRKTIRTKQRKES